MLPLALAVVTSIATAPALNEPDLLLRLTAKDLGKNCLKLRLSHASEGVDEGGGSGLSSLPSSCPAITWPEATLVVVALDVAAALVSGLTTVLIADRLTGVGVDPLAFWLGSIGALPPAFLGYLSATNACVARSIGAFVGLAAWLVAAIALTSGPFYDPSTPLGAQRAMAISIPIANVVTVLGYMAGTAIEWR